MIFEVIFLSMFQYKQAFLFQEIVFEDKIRNGFQSLQFVRRIGKDKIELFTSSFDEFEYIATDRDTFIGLYLLHYLTDESMVVPVLFNADYAVATP